MYNSVKNDLLIMKISRLLWCGNALGDFSVISSTKIWLIAICTIKTSECVLLTCVIGFIPFRSALRKKYYYLTSSGIYLVSRASYMLRIVIGKIQFYKRMPMMKLSTVSGGFQGYQLPLLLKLKWGKNVIMINANLVLSTRRALLRNSYSAIFIF